MPLPWAGNSSPSPCFHSNLNNLDHIPYRLLTFFTFYYRSSIRAEVSLPKPLYQEVPSSPDISEGPPGPTYIRSKWCAIAGPPLPLWVITDRRLPLAPPQPHLAFLHPTLVLRATADVLSHCNTLNTCQCVSSQQYIYRVALLSTATR